jgi:hypothetical protein
MNLGRDGTGIEFNQLQNGIKGISSMRGSVDTTLGRYEMIVNIEA